MLKADCGSAIPPVDAAQRPSCSFAANIDPGGSGIYTIRAGHDMRVYDTRGSERMQVYGHGAGHTQDGWANYWHFSYCR